jgi:hypothetical protein
MRRSGPPVPTFVGQPRAVRSSYFFFNPPGDLVVPGSKFTMATDFQALLVL